MTTAATETLLTVDNFQDKVLRFGTREAGVSIVYDPDEDNYSYNAYCLENELLKELFTVEHEFPEDAVAQINSEFAGWQLGDLHSQKTEGCGSCAAKK